VKPPRTLVIACGALAREFLAVKALNRWDHLEITCLPAIWHNRPEKIPPAVREKIRQNKQRYASIFVAYADCGTGGLLDQVLADEGVERLPGAHCYEFFATPAVFAELSDAEPGTFYLTDFLVRHFDRLVAGTLGIDRHPELIGEYFRHYRRVVYLTQAAPDARLVVEAEAIAVRLGLAFELVATGYGELATVLGDFARRTGTSVVVEPAQASPVGQE